MEYPPEESTRLIYRSGAGAIWSKAHQYYAFDMNHNLPLGVRLLENIFPQILLKENYKISAHVNQLAEYPNLPLK